MCQGLNSHYFHIIGDGHQPDSRGLYTHYKDSVIKGGRFPIPNIATGLTMAHIYIYKLTNFQRNIQVGRFADLLETSTDDQEISRGWRMASWSQNQEEISDNQVWCVFCVFFREIGPRYLMIFVGNCLEVLQTKTSLDCECHKDFGLFMLIQMVTVPICWLNLDQVGSWVVVSNILYFHPEPWGNDPIWLAHIFQLGGSTTN